MRKGTKYRRLTAVLLSFVLVLTLCDIAVFSDNKVKAETSLSNPTINEGVTTWDCIYFGNYYQSNSTTKEPIKWRVLSVNGNDAFLLADQNLDCRSYNGANAGITWEKCALRTWLNDTFFSAAFASAEQAAIKKTTVVNDDNPEYNTEGGVDTEDKVYLLSIAEVSNASYGFDTKFSKKSETREAKNTAYVNGRGVYTENNCGVWWLRSPGGGTGEDVAVAIVGANGKGSTTGYMAFSDSAAVRPVLHLNLSDTTLWSYAGKVKSNDGSTVPTATPTVEPTATPTVEPTATPTVKPTATPTVEPTATPTVEPTATPTVKPTATPTVEPTATPTTEPTVTPTTEPTVTPKTKPTATPLVSESGTDVVTTTSSDSVLTAGPEKMVVRAYAGWKGNKFKVSWEKVQNATEYRVYASVCKNKKNVKSLAKTVKGTKSSAVLKKIEKKKIQKKKEYKIIVKAYRTINGKKVCIGTSAISHVAGKSNKTYTNAKKVKLKKTKKTLRLRAGSAYRIKAGIVKESKKKKLLSKKHGASLRYDSTDVSVATVTSKGKIMPKKAGTCYVYVTALNGRYARVKVVVS